MDKILQMIRISFKLLNNLLIKKEINNIKVIIYLNWITNYKDRLYHLKQFSISLKKINNEQIVLGVVQDYLILDQACKLRV